MAIVELPSPVTRPSEPADGVDLQALAADLRREVDGEVRFDAGSRAAYSTDASNYRQVPLGVVVPHTVEAGAQAVRVASRHGAPVLSRGGGTSLAGQCCNVAVVLDWSKHCHGIVSVDAEAKLAVVEPGIALDRLNDALADTGLMVGPRPSTHVSCTLGGMIGNNSCGATAQAYGKMVDSVERLEVLTYDGLRMWVGATDDEEYERIAAAGGRRGELYAGMRALRDKYMALIRTTYPDIPRRVSGYNLDSLLPENGFHVARALVGSESTLVTVLRAEVRLVAVPKAKTLVVLGYRDIFAAADHVARIAGHAPIGLEGMDDRLVGLERSKHLSPQALDELPTGSGWLMVQFGGADQEEADSRAHTMLADLHEADNAPEVTYLDDPAREEELWEVREAGLGATAYPTQGPETHEGWEDAAVPPERLGKYLRDFQRLLDRYDYGSASLYGHFGQGCVHTRIPFDLRTAAGIAAYRAFVEDAADLVVSYGGSFSGEHGDGQSRGELLPRMYGERIVTAFGQLKALWDPADKMNPGKVVAPYKLDENLRYGTGYQPWQPSTHFSYPADDGLFSGAAHRCVGVGKCRGHESGVMCPSYRVTREEEHSTRGRARLLFEMLQGDVITDGWRSQEVKDALDLCLSCKGCRGDCPVNVDMATYKAEFLSHHYAGRLRPLAHYSMGWLPLWARLAAYAPGAVNALTHAPGLQRLVKAAGGVTQERPVPLFAAQRFTDWFAAREPAGDGRLGEVVLWPDTFSNNLHPNVARAAVEVLEDAGFRVKVPERSVCCGLTWISTGQLSTAKKVLQRTVTVLREDIRAGTPVVGLEPSCTAVLCSDAPELFPGDEDVRRLSQQTFTLAQLLHDRAPDWRPPAVGHRAIAQTHCHQHAIMGFGPDAEMMGKYGIDAEVLDVGCCGLAGNFGFERGHHEVSVACAEQGLWQAVRAAEDDTLVLADGFSCRTQIEHSGAGRVAVHLAEVLAAAVRGEPLGAHPDDVVAVRPAEPSAAARWGTTAAVAVAGALVAPGAVAAWRARRRPA